MSHPQAPFEPAPPLPLGIACAKVIMLFQALPGFLICALFVFRFVISVFADWPLVLWPLVWAFPLAALASAAFGLAIALQPGLKRQWRAALILQGGVGTFFLAAGVSFVAADSATDLLTTLTDPFLLAAAVCWATFALLLLPSSRAQASSPPEDAA
ncbi:hypothetical protein [Nocardiopsis sp. SBT366]|uniref:hypothetical protein n=1 Tax=Nocardiopsis sp. SBT366 TaxID=1580529 RepID=UPI00066E2C53|nr:hypothetical protein [Nocardiopsis sp. SBT366]